MAGVLVTANVGALVTVNYMAAIEGGDWLLAAVLCNAFVSAAVGFCAVVYLGTTMDQGWWRS